MGLNNSGESKIQEIKSTVICENVKPLIKKYGEQIKVVMKPDVLSIKIDVDQGYIVVLIPLVFFTLPLLGFAEWPVFLVLGIIFLAVTIGLTQAKSFTLDVQTNTIKIQHQYLWNVIRMKPQYYLLEEVSFYWEELKKENQVLWNSMYFRYKSKRKNEIFFVSEKEAMTEFILHFETFYPGIKIEKKQVTN